MVALFVAANYVLASGDFTADDDLLITAQVAGIGLVFGLLVGRWWALWLPSRRQA